MMRALCLALVLASPPGLRLRWGKEPAALSMALARALALFWITNACNRVSKTITVIALHGNMSHCNKTNIMLG
jgi:hypothetical protein